MFGTTPVRSAAPTRGGVASKADYPSPCSLGQTRYARRRRGIFYHRGSIAGSVFEKRVDLPILLALSSLVCLRAWIWAHRILRAETADQRPIRTAPASLLDDELNLADTGRITELEATGDQTA